MSTDAPDLRLIARIARALPAGLRDHPHLAPLRFVAGDRGSRPAYLAQLTRNLRALAERDRLLGQLPVPTLVVKGGDLADALYPEPALRYFSDLDLLVESQAAASAIEPILEASGYVAWRFPERMRLGLEHHVHWRDPAGNAVEVHWALWHELGVDGSPGSLFAHRRGRGPSMTDHLWIVAIHAAAHAFALGPAWLVDLALLLAHPETDLRAAADEAERRRGGLALETALGIARLAFTADSELAARFPPPRRRRARLLVERLGGRLLGGWAESLPRSFAVRSLLFESPIALADALVRKTCVRVAEALRR